MRRAISINKDLKQIHTVEDLTEVFESIASLRISKIRNRVIASKAFFADLWQTYQGLRIDPKKRLTSKREKNGRKVFLAVTSEGKLGGLSDEQIITNMLIANTNPQNTDIVVIGSHGAGHLRQAGIKPIKEFALPVSDSNFSVADIISVLDKYDQISVFYQTYNSLQTQQATQIELISAVQELSSDVAESEQTVSSRDYIFEPSIDKIAEYMESVMLGVALIQIIMETKLAQYANRFNNMSRATQQAKQLTEEYKHEYHHAKRTESDERIKEIMRASRSIK
ncbi:MAG: FoF1 ATP synthase subunit gamma [Candidatus Woesebacteria bacterium]|jgi:ATP synthase F1 gamma subunit